MEHWCNWCGDFQLHNYETCPKRFPKYVYVFLIQGKKDCTMVNAYNSKKRATCAMIDFIEFMYKENNITNPPSRKEIKNIVKQNRKKDYFREPYYYIDNQYNIEDFSEEDCCIIKKVEILN